MRVGYSAAFLALSAIAAVAAALFWIAMPETGPVAADSPAPDAPAPIALRAGKAAP